MERERYLAMRRVIRQTAGCDPNVRHTHSDATIILVLLWAALHDKPIVWACQPRRWPIGLRPRPLPTQSCMSRRLRTVEVLTLLERLHRVFRERLPRSAVKHLDAKPLAIGGCTKDRDARFGRGAGMMAKGYKLHVLADALGAIEGWLVAPMNYPEQDAAQLLLDHLGQDPCLVVADHNFDANRLYDRAGDRGAWLLASPPKNAKALGHHRQSHRRLAALAFAKTDAGATLLAGRAAIERLFGRLCSSAVALDHLPMHARRQRRVTRWVAIKLLILAELQHQDLRHSEAA